LIKDRRLAASTTAPSCPQAASRSGPIDHALRVVAAIEADDFDLDLPRVLTMRAALQLGISRAAIRHAVARRRWRRLAQGVFLTVPGPPTRDDWVQVGMAITGPDAALSGWDALRTYGLGAATPPGATVLVLDRAGSFRQIACVRIRPTARPYATRVLPFAHPTLPYVSVVSAARAVADTALMYRRLAPVRALVTSSVQREKCSLEELTSELESCPRNGSGMFRRAIADVLDGARSIAEAEAAEALQLASVPSFEQNVDVVDATGRLVAKTDLLWRELRAVAEIDSREFHFYEDGWENTVGRHNLLTRGGLALEHYTPRRIRSDPKAWAAEVESWLRARAQEVGQLYIPGDGPIRHGGKPPPLVLPFVVPASGNNASLVRDQQRLSVAGTTKSRC
jgi:hypothetical protein